jgi:predicted ATPase/signal transduction histidine kinase
MQEFERFRVLDNLYESPRSLVYRAALVGDDQPLILKILKESYPHPDELTRYKQEFVVASRLTSDYVSRARELLPHGRSLMLVSEDFGAESLDKIVARRAFEPEEVVRLAIQLASALEDIHRADVIHKDIKPANLILNEKTGRLRVIDFGSSTVLSQEPASALISQSFEGTLAFISPEQTGRMNRQIDYRTDFYSLGVTLYQLLTGRLPFDTQDPLELLHCHLAKAPAPPSAVKPAVPPPLSAIVMKLLQKNAEERYQSASGLRHDLDVCLSRMTEGRAGEVFPLGTKDIPQRFRIPQKLYGREHEIERLTRTFEQAAEGGTQLLLIGGYSGIGKSSIVNELYKPVTRRRGYFISGKFDQLKRNVPYSALVTAFRGLVQQILCESNAQLIEWRKRLTMALGKNARVLLDLIPEIEHILGALPAVPELGPVETQSRFQMALASFFDVICQPAHPVTLFLDDLQWVDAASLKLLQALFGAESARPLLVIGSYRDNEVDATHPLMMFINEAKSQGRAPARIHLGPLRREDLLELCADSLHSDVASVTPLAELLLEKTGGNPFFVNQFLRSLAAQKQIFYDQAAGGWRWDLAGIKASAVTDNVADLIGRNLRELPASTRRALQLASCIGSTFPLDTLALIYGASPADTHDALQPALEVGLILSSSELQTTGDDVIGAKLVYGSYRFLHDRVQQACRALLPPHKEQEIHLRLGRLLLERLSPEETRERLFEIVDHLNIGARLITDEAEKRRSARLNLEAGQRAKRATAYAASRAYLRAGIDVVDTWMLDRALAVALHLECAKVECILGSFDEADALIDLLLEEATSDLQIIAVYEARIWQYSMQGRFVEAIQTGSLALDLVGMSLPDGDVVTAIQQELSDFDRQLGRRPVSSLLDLPEMTDTRIGTAVRLITLLVGSMFMTSPLLCAFASIKLVNLSLKYGNCPESAAGYHAFFIPLWLFRGGAHQLAHDFGELALRLSDRYGNQGQKSKGCMNFAGGAAFWVRPLRETIPILEEGVRAGLESGEIPEAGYNLLFKVHHRYHLGANLRELMSELDDAIRFCDRTKNGTTTLCIQALRMAVSNLLGRTADERTFSDESLDERGFEEHPSKTPMAGAHFLSVAAEVHFIHRNTAEALKAARGAAELMVVVPGQLVNAVNNAIYSLALAAEYPGMAEAEREEARETLEKNQQRMLEWAESCPENFLHYYLLIEAERARLRGEVQSAWDLYVRAIEEAARSGFVQCEAVACEVAGRYWLSAGRDVLARHYLDRALRCYSQWGAERKVKQMLRDHRMLLDLPPSRDGALSPLTTLHTTADHVGEAFDLLAITKASQAISSEVDLQALIRRLLFIVLENAGATRGAVVLHGESGPVVYLSDAREDGQEALRASPLSECSRVPQAIVQYVLRTQENVILPDAHVDPVFGRDPDIARRRPRSVLCIPMMQRGRLCGALYLEHTELSNVFRGERLRMLEVLAAQAAISVENAGLYAALIQKNKELGGALERAEETARLKNEFLANTSHELRTPLNSIINIPDGILENMERVRLIYCDRCGLRFGQAREARCPGCGGSDALIEQESCLYMGPPDEFQHYMELSRANGQQLLSVVSDILDISKLETGRMRISKELISLGDLIEETMSIIRPGAQKRGITVERRDPSDLVIEADPVRIRQILTNLIDNAVKFSDDGGVVTVDIRVEGEDVLLSVSDRGIGIEEREHERIFTSFYQVSGGDTRRAGGTGVGLTITKQLVELHGGQIWVKSRVGQGSTFYVRLPRGSAIESGSIESGAMDALKEAV